MAPTAVQATVGPIVAPRRAQGGTATGELVQQARSGSVLAWRQLVARFDGSIRATARRFRLGEADAGDVAQTTWLRLVEHIDRVQDPERIEGWLVTTASRESLALLRRQKRERPSETGCFDELIDRTANDPESRALDQELQQAVRDAVDELPPTRRRLLWSLASPARPCYADVALAAGMPIGSVGPTRQRAVRQVRQTMQERGFPFSA